MSTEHILSNLNSSQRAAVSCSANTLAILAGPGSGKTHTLTARTAYLLKELGLQPWNVIIATFTVKAAKEMKERIGRLIGDGMESKLILGTFHSISRRYLSRYGHLIDIKKDFGIADSSDSLAIVKRIIKRHKLTIEPPAARNRISSRKAKGGLAVERKSVPKSAEKALEIQEFEICYTEYEEALKRSNLLDYDDLLLRCVDLLRQHPSCVSNVEAVLIDEFQDTNIVQFDLMRLFAAQRKRVTIVGDPDQSIYGWRAAETKNFKRMLQQYPETVTIPLEENYRSSGAILLGALELIQQDEGRIEKSLMPTHVVGTRPVLRKLSSAHSEAQWIITEIKRTIILTGDLMTFNDVAILLRSASLSRHIESALGKAGIPYRMVGGLKFFDRVEVKVILDYLRVINLPDNNDALARVINVPSRRIGDETVKHLLDEADKAGITLWKLILDHVQGIRNSKTKLPKQTEQGLSAFVNIILTARKKLSDPVASSPLSTKDLIDFVMNKTSFEDYLEKSYSEDYESRLANIQELVNQAADFTDANLDGHEDDEALPEVEGLPQEGLSNPLSKFLANIALASAIEASEANGPPRTEVTVSTIHAAKGLEWPVVFIPATYQGSIPHSRADDDNEERRLLYVAMTRAKALLYMSYPFKNSQREQTTLSPFLKPTSLKVHLDDKGPSFTFTVTQAIAQILRRPVPSVDFSAAGSSLESFEDDLFAIDGEEDDENGSKWQERDGDPHYSEGQRLPKRQRVEERSDTTVQHAWRPAYSTTMTQISSFSTASVTVGGGFISAGSHFKELSVQAHSNLDGQTKSNVTTSGTYAIFGDKKEGTTKSKSRTTRRPEGQGSLMSYFAQAPNRPPRVQTSSSFSAPPREVRSAPKAQNAFMPIQLRQSYSAPPVSVHGVDPSLGNHRLGSGQLRVPARRQHDTEGVKKNDYVFLSSSPQAVEALIRDGEEPNMLDLNKPDLVTDIEPLNPVKSRPATTMHVTSVAKMSAIIPTKTLGVRRSMNGWANRKGQVFVPPSMNRPK